MKEGDGGRVKWLVGLPELVEAVAGEAEVLALGVRVLAVAG